MALKKISDIIIKFFFNASMLPVYCTCNRLIKNANKSKIFLSLLKQVDQLHVSNTNMYQLGLLLQQWSDNMVGGFVNCTVESIVGPHWNITSLFTQFV